MVNLLGMDLARMLLSNLCMPASSLIVALVLFGIIQTTTGMSMDAGEDGGWSIKSATVHTRHASIEATMSTFNVGYCALQLGTQYIMIKYNAFILIEALGTTIFTSVFLGVAISLLSLTHPANESSRVFYHGTHLIVSIISCIGWV